MTSPQKSGGTVGALDYASRKWFTLQRGSRFKATELLFYGLGGGLPQAMI